MKSIGIAIKTKQADLNKECERNIQENHTSIESRLAANAKPIISEFHLNIWKPKTHICSFNEIFALDFGLIFPKNCDSIYFYFPFKLVDYKTDQSKKKKRVWTDLGEWMAKNNDLICTIFNDELQTTKVSNTCYYNVSSTSKDEEDKGESKNRSFFLYTLGDTNIEFDKDIEDGTLMNIKIFDTDILQNQNSLTSPNSIYIRFRIFVKAKDIRIRRSISNDLIQAAFSKLDLYDFKINEAMNLDWKIREKFRETGHQLTQFSKAHIFYICSTKTSVQNGSLQKNDSRLVDPDKWKFYEPFNMHGNIYISHHWKFTNKIQIIKDYKHRIWSENEDIPFKDVKLFCTAQYPKLQLFTLSVYFLLIILLGAIGSFLASPDNSKLETLKSFWTVFPFILAVCLITIWLLRPIRIKVWTWIKEL